MFTLVLPVYNEAEILEGNVRKILDVFKKIEEDYEIIIANDNSSDRSKEIGKNLASNHRQIFFINLRKNLGRGRAIKRACKEAEGDVILFTDIDLPVDPRYISLLLELAKEKDIVTGSRYLKESTVKRPFLREAFSRLYNFLIRVFLDVEIYDSQCGLKAFSRNFMKNKVLEIEEDSWAWDTVILVEAVKEGYSLEEFPVNWFEKRDPSHSASLKRILDDLRLHGRVLLKLFIKWRLKLQINL